MDSILTINSNDTRTEFISHFANAIYLKYDYFNDHVFLVIAYSFYLKNISQNGFNFCN